MKIKRIRRGCYDKYHRCPGWVGGGWKWPKDKNVVCDGGSLSRVINYDDPWWRWKFYTCPICHTLILPYNQRYLDPTFLYFLAKRKIEDWKYDRSR